MADRVRKEREVSDRVDRMVTAHVLSGRKVSDPLARNARSRSDRFRLWPASVARRGYLRKKPKVGLIRWSALPFFHTRQIGPTRLFFPKLAFGFEEFREYPTALDCQDPAGDLHGVVQPRIIQ